MSKIIECENITHYYGNRLIYENLSFDVEQGKVLGLLGKNGTGKTTIINILNGYLKPRSGVCRLFGEEMEHLSAYQIEGGTVAGRPCATCLFYGFADREILFGLLPEMEERGLL